MLSQKGFKKKQNQNQPLARNDTKFEQNTHYSFFNAEDMYLYFYPPYPKHIVFIYGATSERLVRDPCPHCVEWNDGSMGLIYYAIF